MGCIHSKRTFSPNNQIAGQEDLCLDIFDQLNFTNKEVDALFHAFCEIDVHHVGSIRPIELFTFFNIEVGPFEEAMFSVFDEDKSGKLTFLEFVCSMWNLLSIPTNIMGSLCYLVKDPSGCMRIHYNDVRDVMEMMHRKKVESASSLSLVMNDLRSKYSAELSVQDVCKWTTTNSSILSPIVIMQLKFRKQLLGEKYWTKATDERAADKERSTVDWMRKFFEMVRKKSAEQRRIRKEAATAVNKRDNMTESQRNIHDKQTLLLSSFNMIQQPANSRGQPNTSTGGDEDAQISPSAKRKRRQSGEGFNNSSPQRVAPGGGASDSRKSPSGLDTVAESSGGVETQQQTPKRPSSSRKSSSKNVSTDSSPQAQSKPRTSAQADVGSRKNSTKGGR